VDEDLAVPLRIHSGDLVLSFISTITTFARATDITVAELSIESFYPTDQKTAGPIVCHPLQRRGSIRLHRLLPESATCYATLLGSRRA
jgi:hypothetical protein